MTVLRPGEIHRVLLLARQRDTEDGMVQAVLAEDRTVVDFLLPLDDAKIVVLGSDDNLFGQLENT